MKESLKRESRYRKCIHQKNLILLYDADLTSPESQFLQSHMKSCVPCQGYWNDFNFKMEASKVFIPKPMMDRELRVTLGREIHDLFKNLKMTKKDNRKNSMQKMFESISLFSDSLKKSIVNKHMFIAYGVATFIYILLHRTH